MPVITAFETADQRIRLATLHRKRADDGRVGTHDGTRRFRVDAGAADKGEIIIDIVAVTRIVFRVDHGKIRMRTDAQAEALQARLDDLRTADEDRDAGAFFQEHLGGAQHALVFAFGKDDALLFGGFRGIEDRLHDEAGAPDETVQLVEIGFEIGDRPGGDAACGRCTGDSRRDAQDETRIERRGNEIVRAEDRCFTAIGFCRDFRDFLTRKLGDGLHGGHLHFLVDRGCAAIQRAAEDIGEAQYVVDLVREVRTAGADHRIRAGRTRRFRHDFRIGVGKRQDQRVFRHALQQFRLQNTGGRKAEEDVGAVDGFGQHTLVGLLGVNFLPLVHQLVAAVINEAFDVVDPDVFLLRAHGDQQVEAGKRRSTRA
ncbi:hypothetical protein D3C71_512970 [compost metagenome]